MRAPSSSSCVPRLDRRARSLVVLTGAACHARVAAAVAGAIHRFGAGVGRYDEQFPMLARTDLRGTSDLRRALARPAAASDDVSAVVAAIVADVRTRGDDALREYTQRFDRSEID